MSEQPGEPAGGVLEAEHAEPQRAAGEGPADGQHRRRAGRGTIGLGARQRAELLRDIGHDPTVRGRGRRQHGHVGGHLRDQIAQSPVVGTEIMPPVADAVRLVDHEHAESTHQRRELLLPEPGVVQSLRGDEQHVDLVPREPILYVGPLVRVRGVDRDRTHPGPFGCSDLVAHQSQKRGDEHGRARSLTAAQQGRDEVHGRLAPARSLHDQGTAAPLDERLDRLVLAVVEVDVGATDQLAESGAGGGAGGIGGCEAHVLHSAPGHGQGRVSSGIGGKRPRAP